MSQIMGRTAPDVSRRHAYTPPKPGPGGPEAPPRSAPPPPAKPEHLVQQPPSGPLTRYTTTTRALPEQTARGYKPPYSSQPPTARTRPAAPPHAQEQREWGYASPSPSAAPAPAPAHQTSRPYPRSQAAYGPQPQHQFSEQEQEQDGYANANEYYHAVPRAHRPNDYQQPSPFTSPLPADAIPVWETEDEEPGMRYDDWESDEPIVYQRADVEIVANPAHPYSNHPAPARSAPYATEREPAGQKGHSGTERRTAHVSVTPVPLPASAPQGREMPRVQRMTQPLTLRPNGNGGMGYEQHDQRGPAAPEGPRVPQTPQLTSPRPTPQLAPPHHETNVRLAAVPSRGPCPLCKGAGYLRANVQFGHPQFGKPIPCQCKEQEKREKRRQQLLELSDIGAFRTRTFSNFNARFAGIHPSVQEAFDAAYNFAQNPNGWLLLMGPNGCGKTHLAAAIANHCLNEGEVVLFSVVPQLLDHLRAAFAPSSSEVYDQLFAKMREAGILVLDDLGAHYGTPWAAEKLFQLLNYRYNWRMPTIITCNVQGLQSLDLRLRSRMNDHSLVVTVNLERARDCRPYLIRQEP